MQQLQFLPNLVFTQPEFSTTAVPVAVTTLALQTISGTAAAGSNTAYLTFSGAHGYTATLGTNGVTTYANGTTHGPSGPGGLYTYFQLTNFTGQTLVNGVTMVITGVPDATHLNVYCSLTGTATASTSKFVPVFVPTYGDYNLFLGANCTVQYNPDNTGAPVLPGGTNPGAAPTFRTMMAASTSTQVEFEGVGQTIIIASGSAGTSYWSLYAH